MYIPIVLAFALLHPNPTSGAKVTIYNQGFAFVEETRVLDLKPGLQTIKLVDVPSTIDPTSVAIRDLNHENGIEVLEQNYENHLITIESILGDLVGKQIQIIAVPGPGSVEGTVLAAPTSITSCPDGSQIYVGMVLHTTGGNYLLSPKGEININSIPEGLVSQPSLVWSLNSTESGPTQADLFYMASGISWSADYVMSLDPNGSTANLQGWASIKNDSGASFNDAQLKLLAGQVNVAPQARLLNGAMAGAMLDQAKQQFNESSSFEYHLYTLQRPTTIADKETKQISLFTARGVPYTRELIIQQPYFNPMDSSAGSPVSPQIKLVFKNSSVKHLGMSLPAGKIRVYKQDSDGSSEFVGEDNINHTPKDEGVSIAIGNSFDVTSTRTQTDYRNKINNDPKADERTIQIQIKNHGNAAEKIVVLEYLQGDWTIEKSSDPFTKFDSQTIRFVIQLKANSNHTVSYTVMERVP